MLLCKIYYGGLMLSAFAPVSLSVLPLKVTEPPKEEIPHLPFAIAKFQEMISDPDKYCDPISLSLIQDPVVDKVGATYDRSSILEHFEIQKQKKQPLTSPLTGELLPSEELLPNRDKKSEIADYKTRKANECFAKAKECLFKKCGETALLLLDRVKELNPAKEGLAEAEEAARDTFISVERKMVNMPLRIESMLQARQVLQAVMFLKPFVDEPGYRLIHGESNGREIVKSDLFESNMNPTYDLSFKKMHDLEIKCGRDLIFTQDLKYCMTQTAVLNQSDNECIYTCYAWEVDTQNAIRVLYRHVAKNVNNVITKPSIVSIGDSEFVLHFNGERKISIFNLATNRTVEFDVCEYFNVKVGTTSRIKISPLRLSGGIKRSVSDDEYMIGIVISCDENLAFLGSNGVPKRINASIVELTKKGIFVGDFFFSAKFDINANEFIKLYLPEYLPNQERWNGRWPCIPFGRYDIKDPSHINQVSYAKYNSNLKRFRDRIIIYTKDSISNDTIVGTLVLTYIVPKNLEKMVCYTTAMKVALLANDLDFYLNACEHLMGYARETRTWTSLERVASSFKDTAKPIISSLELLIAQAAKTKDHFFTARLQLSLGLLLETEGKKRWYVAAESLKTSYRPVESGIEFLKDSGVELNPGNAVAREPTIQDLQTQIQHLQEQHERLQKLVNQILLK